MVTEEWTLGLVETPFSTFRAQHFDVIENSVALRYKPKAISALECRCHGRRKMVVEKRETRREARLGRATTAPQCLSRDFPRGKSA